MHVCNVMYVCILVCMYVYYMSMYVCMDVRMYVCILSMCVYYLCMYFMYVCMYVCHVYVCMCVPRGSKQRFENVYTKVMYYAFGGGISPTQRHY